MTCVNLYDVAAPTCTRIVATILLYYCATALLYDSRDWKQLKRDINAWLLYYCTTAQQHYCTTQGIDNNLKLYINSSLLWVYNCKITLLDHTGGLNRTSAGYPFVAIVLLYYWLLLHTSAPTCAAWALRDYCVSSAWGRPPICWGDTHDFEIVLPWFNSLIRFYYGFPKLYNGYHDDVWLRLLLTSISFVKLNTMGIKELMIVTASLDK